MKNYQKFFGSMLIGTISGIMILGILGRAATIGIALVAKRSINLSLSGSLQVILFAAFIGAIGGIFIYLFQRIFQAKCLTCAIINSFLLFLISSFYLFLLGTLSFNFSVLQFFTIGVVALIFIIYGLIVCRLVRRFKANRRNYL